MARTNLKVESVYLHKQDERKLEELMLFHGLDSKSACFRMLLRKAHRELQRPRP